MHLPSSTLEGDGAERCVAGVGVVPPRVRQPRRSHRPRRRRISCVMHALEPAEFEQTPTTTRPASPARRDDHAQTTRLPVPGRGAVRGLGRRDVRVLRARARGNTSARCKPRVTSTALRPLRPRPLDPNSCTVEEPAFVEGDWTAGRTGGQGQLPRHVRQRSSRPAPARGPPRPRWSSSRTAGPGWSRRRLSPTVDDASGRSRGSAPPSAARTSYACSPPRRRGSGGGACRGTTSPELRFD